MINKLKDFFDNHKSKAIICLCFVSVYIAGVVSAKQFQFSQETNLAKEIQPNFTTNTKEQRPEQQPKGNTTEAKESQQDCLIKGNIGSGSRKVYHMPGGSFYERTEAEMCFNSEDEALSAGFIKSSR